MFLICYTPGARGDFLASLLLNQHFKNKATINTPTGYKKVHWINHSVRSQDFNLQDPKELLAYTSIRISINSDLEFAKLLYHRYTKPMVHVNHEPRDELDTCLFEEEHNRQYESYFDYIISIDDIDDIHLLEAFYCKIHNQNITPRLKQLAVDNIKLNQIPRNELWDKLVDCVKIELDRYCPAWVQRLL